MKRVILCRPEGPRNVGSVLRAVQNFGPCELHLVAPLKPSILVHPDFVQMSHGADEARAAIVVHERLEDALADVHHSVGFTARVRGNRQRRDWREAQPDVLGFAESTEDRLALVFGNEETGMTAEEAGLCNELVHIRTSEHHTSLNLAMCATVVLSDLFVGRGHVQPEPGGRLLDGNGREFLKARMTEVFAHKIAKSPEASKLIEASIERVFSRAELENRDARAWHLMLKALGSTMRPDQVGLTVHVKGQRRKMFLDKHLDGTDAATDK